MSLWRILARRLVAGGLLVYGFLSAIFFGFALTPDPTGRIGGEVEAGRYGFIRGSPDAGAAGLSLFERYV